MLLNRVSYTRVLGTRCFSTSVAHCDVVKLASEHFQPNKGASAVTGGKGPIVILHGLFGSKQNWRSFARGMAKKMQREVVTLDMRNHGNSPHSPEFNYYVMAEDVAHYLDEHKIEDSVIVGHSMGGKVAMALTLKPHDAVKKLVVIDIAPGVGKISGEFQQYLDAMKEIERANVHERKEADAILAKYESDVGVRQFILTNIQPSKPKSPLRFRIPLEYIGNGIGEIGEFPYAPGSRHWDGPALFLKGSKSKYINHKNTPLLTQYFPHMRLETLEAGHWVHVEQPKKTMQLIEDFINEKDENR